MKCPSCKSKTVVVDSRDKGKIIRRRRKCKKCELKFTTKEKIFLEIDEIKNIKHVR
jgi:transcriptional repressor NrdR